MPDESPNHLVRVFATDDFVLTKPRGSSSQYAVVILVVFIRDFIQTLLETSAPFSCSVL